jgi:hypothetical protein
MKAEQLLDERLILSSRAFVELVIWRVPQPIRASTHQYKYRLAYVANGVCVLRFDNEAGKGDHKHVADVEVPYEFIDLGTLQADFWSAVKARRR